MINQLRCALQEQQFLLLYQPQAHVQNSRLIGFEALLRFIDDKGTTIYPEEFIPILEETSMIIEVGKWVLEKACQQLHQWHIDRIFPENGFLSINVSPKQLLDKSFISLIINTCNKYQINPQQLVIEVTENVLIDKPEKVLNAMESLKSIGVKLSLDDFGTGYSSLSYLQRYPFDHLKIDKSFVSQIIEDKNGEKITRSIIALAESLGLQVTAEGVTEPRALDIIKEYGANYYQGYLLSEPLSINKASELLKYQIGPDESNSGVTIL